MKVHFPVRRSLLLAHPWHGVPTHPAHSVETCNAYIEIVPADAVKYELDKASGHLRLDRPQRFSSLCPAPYGFIPQTYCGAEVGARSAQRLGRERMVGDGDPLDVCVLTEKPIAHGGFLAHVRPIGGLRMVDAEEADDKIIAVLESDLAFGDFVSIEDCPAGLIERLQHYFLGYKQRPGDMARSVSIAEVYGRDEAFEVIQCSLRDYEAYLRASPELMDF